MRPSLLMLIHVSAGFPGTATSDGTIDLTYPLMFRILLTLLAIAIALLAGTVAYFKSSHPQDPNTLFRDPNAPLRSAGYVFLLA